MCNVIQQTYPCSGAIGKLLRQYLRNFYEIHALCTYTFIHVSFLIKTHGKTFQHLRSLRQIDHKNKSRVSYQCF